MARVAIRDTFAFERVGLIPGDETEVKRLVKAGQEIPAQYRVADEDAVQDVSGPPKVGLGAAPHAYKHQLDESGSFTEEHRS